MVGMRSPMYTLFQPNIIRGLLSGQYRKCFEPMVGLHYHPPLTTTPPNTGIAHPYTQTAILTSAAKLIGQCRFRYHIIFSSNFNFQMLLNSALLVTALLAGSSSAGRGILSQAIGALECPQVSYSQG